MPYLLNETAFIFLNFTLLLWSKHRLSFSESMVNETLNLQKLTFDCIEIYYNNNNEL